MSTARQKATRLKEAVVQRSYDTNPEACASAVALLLQSPAEKKKAVEGHHPDSRDKKGRSQDGFLADEASIQR
ncbi:MAG: hypothetical protein H0T57_10115 [Rubrobacter sp.]|nr:hypothetical protein [Rubrobacter sp.]